MSIVLQYIGNGRWMPGVPKRDLTQKDIDQRNLTVDDLIESGLYKKAKTRKKPAPSEDKLQTGGAENKE